MTAKGPQVWVLAGTSLAMFIIAGVDLFNGHYANGLVDAAIGALSAWFCFHTLGL